MKHTSIIGILLSILIILSCGTQHRSSGDARAQSRVPVLAILDFSNATGDPELDMLGHQIAETLTESLAYNFSIFDPTIVRAYVESLGYTGANLYDRFIAETIGRQLEADYILRGEYTVLRDEIQIVFVFTPIRAGLSSYRYTKILKKNSPLEDLVDIAPVIQMEAADEIPEILEIPELGINEDTLAAATSPERIEELVYVYLTSEEFDNGDKENFDSEDIVYEEPSPKPNWVDQIPMANDKIYFVGYAYNQDGYERALTVAFQDVYRQIIQSINQSITLEDSGNVEGENLSQSFLINMLSSIENIYQEKTYYIVRSEDNLSSAAVLYSMDKMEMEETITQQIDHHRIQIAQQMEDVQSDLILTQNQEEAKALEERLQNLQEQSTQLNSLDEQELEMNISITSSMTNTSNMSVPQDFLRVLTTGSYPNYMVELGTRLGIYQPFGTMMDKLDIGFAGSIFARYNPDLVNGLVGELEVIAVPLTIKDNPDHIWTALGIAVGPRYELPPMDFFSISFYLNTGAYFSKILKDKDTDWFSTFLLKIGVDFGFELAYHSQITLGVYYQPTFSDVGVQGLSAYLSYGYRIGAQPRENQLQMIDYQLVSLFPAQYKLFASRSNIGSIVLTNIGEEPITNIQLAVFNENYMDEPTMIRGNFTLEPTDELEIPLKAVFNENILTNEENRSINLNIALRYTIQRQTYTKYEVVTLNMYQRNALVWEINQEVCAFVSNNDPIISKIRSSIESEFPNEGLSSLINANINRAIRAFILLKRIGLDYIPDPNSTLTGNPVEGQQALDRVMFPGEFLQASNRTGDCDDFAVLYASLLESIGIETAFLITDVHIFLAFNTNKEEHQLSQITSDPNSVIIHDGEVWIPIETTFLDKDYEGFMAAWEMGLKEYQNNLPNLNFIPTIQGWENFPPVTLPINQDFEPLIDYDLTATDYQATVESYVQSHRESLTLTNSEVIAQLSVDQRRQAIKDNILSGSMETALRLALSLVDQGIATALDYFYLGNIYYHMGDDYQIAIDAFLSAESSVSSEDNSTIQAKIYIGLAFCYKALNDSSNQSLYFQKACEIVPAFERRFSQLSQ